MQKFDFDRLMRKHDWRRTISHGVDLALEALPMTATLRDHNVVWALVKEAAFVSRVTYPAPPRSSFPSKAALPDAPDDVTQWQLISAYLRGDIDSLPATVQARPAQPSKEQIDRCEVILEVWHRHALKRKGDRSRMKKAIWLKANNAAARHILAVTGLSRQRVQHAQNEAMRDMWAVIKKY